MAKTGNRINLIAFRGQRFGQGVVIDPEVRVGVRPNKPYGYRAARLECVCGTLYVAHLSHLYRGDNRCCPGCSRRGAYRKRRKVGGLISRNGDAYVVNVYVGRYSSREQAEAVARRARAYLIPEKTLEDVKNGAVKTLT